MDIFKFLHNLLLLGALQGFIICCLLFFTGPRHANMRVLAKVLLCYSLVCLDRYLYDSDWIQQNPFWRTGIYLLPLMIVMPVGPLIFRYVKAHQKQSYMPQKKERLWSLVIIIDLVPYFAAWFFILGVLSGLVKNNPWSWGVFIDTWQQYADIPRWLSLAVGLFFSWRLVIKKDLTDEETWIKPLLKVFSLFLILWLLQLIPYMVPQLRPRGWGKIEWYCIYIPLVILIYWLGFNSFLLSRKEKQVSKTKDIAPEVIGDIGKQLTRAMEGDQLFLDPDLNLFLLARHVGAPPKTVSVVLNQYYKKSFSDFVNTYRVEAFKQKIVHADLSAVTIISIAKECGFSSQATFQRIFKQVTGMTPTGFLKKELG